MRIKYADIWLTGNGDDPNWTAAQDVHVNGQRVVQEVQYLRATTLSFIPRGGRSILLEFTVGRQFASHQEAEAFMLSHFQDLPEKGDVEIHLHSNAGEDAAVATAVDAVLSAVPIGPRNGIWLGATRYSLKFATISGVSYVPQPEPTVRGGTLNIPSGVDTVALSGLTNLGAVPRQILCTIRKPATGDFNLVATVRDDSITATAFTVDLSGETDKAGYKLDYLRIL